ncbi:MAG: hypothetical protein JF615_02930, partial [Asticcacaulis sp.]|nr:hypothetical protein [Asticcacaulis sp.]
MREFRGKLEAVKDATVVGWAYGAGSDDPHVRFRLKINDKDSGVHVADQFREDLRRKQIGDGHHGFRIPVAAELFQPGENLIEVFAEPEAIKIGATLVYSHAVAPAPTPKPVMRGKLERVRGDHIVGWLFDPEAPARHVAFELRVNGEPAGHFVAAEMRDDLIAAKMGAGDHAFRIPLPTERLVAGDNVLEIRLTPDGPPIGSPLVHGYTPPPPKPVPPPAPKPVLRGKLERVRGDHVIGWLFDPDAPARHVAFELLVNGEPVGSFLAGDARDDLIAARMGDGDHAFRVPLPTDRLAAGDNVLEIRLAPDGPVIDKPLVHTYTPPPPKPAPKPALRGKLERIRGDRVIGWLFDSTRPNIHLGFDLVINGESAGAYTAAEMRDDLVAAGMGQGDHAFSVDLPKDRLVAGDNLVAIRLSEDGQFIDRPLTHTHVPPQPKPAVRGKLERI